MRNDPLRAIDIFYDSIGDSFDADRALQAYSIATDDSGVALANVSAMNGNASTVDRHQNFWTYNAPPVSVAAFGEQLGNSNDITLQHFRRLQIQKPVFFTSLIPHDNPRAHAMIQELSQPWGIHSEVMSILGRDGAQGSFCVALRHAGQAEFDADAFTKMGILNRHLNRAMTLQNRLDAFELAVGRASGALDLIDMGLVLYDHAARPVLVNKFAHRLFADQDGLLFDRKGVVAQNRDAHQKLNDILQKLHSYNSAQTLGAGDTMQVPRPSGKKPYSVMAIPLNGYRKHGTENVDVALFICDPDMQDDKAIKVFAASYRLTPSETALTRNLVQGGNLSEFAEMRGISRNTAKWHLQTIFGKTGTSRQHELVSLVLRTAIGAGFPKTVDHQRTT